jgi:hypothetical protein
VSAWTDYAELLLDPIRYLYRQAGLPCWLTLAMAAHESGVPPDPQSTLVLERNPWGVVCFEAQYPCSHGFQVYPDLMAAARSLLLALGPDRLRYASDPVAFVQYLQATDWDVPPDDYANSILYTWGPPAQRALVALGLDITTGQPPAAPAQGGTSVSIPPGPNPLPSGVNWWDVSLAVLLLGGPVAAYVAVSTPAGHAWVHRHFGLRRQARR